MNINKLIPGIKGFERFFFVDFDECFPTRMHGAEKLKRSDSVPVFCDANVKTIKGKFKLFASMFESRAHYIFIPVKDSESKVEIIYHCIDVIKKTNPEAGYSLVTDISKNYDSKV